MLFFVQLRWTIKAAAKQLCTCTVVEPSGRVADSHLLSKKLKRAHQCIRIYKSLLWIWLFEAESKQQPIESDCAVSANDAKAIELIWNISLCYYSLETAARREAESGGESLDLFVLDRHSNFLQKLFPYLPHSNDA